MHDTLNSNKQLVTTYITFLFMINNQQKFYVLTLKRKRTLLFNYKNNHLR